VGRLIWDHIQVGWHDDVADPWIALAAIASATKRIQFGAIVTPVARRHPWKLAREAVTLDHLSEGRVVFGVGLGEDMWSELSGFGTPSGTPTNDRVRAEMLDEGLTVITGLWSGAPFAFQGKHYTVKETTFLPKPIQSPRIPIWVAGQWPHKPPFRRAARYEGVVPMSADPRKALTPNDVSDIVAYVRKHRSSSAPLEALQSGVTKGESQDEDAVIVKPFAEAGATWWLETILPWLRSVDETRSRIRKGPPRL